MSSIEDEVAQACRVLAAEGLAHETAGHVSARSDDGLGMHLRCRGEAEEGVRWTSSASIRKVGLSGEGDIGDRYELPLELPIHGELYKANPSVRAVVHVHAPYSVLCGVAGLDLRPVYGAFDGDGLVLARTGVPIYPRARLISTASLGADVAAVIGERQACILRGHGIVTVGASVAEAALVAIRLERLAWFTWQLGLAHAAPPLLSQDDMDFFRPDWQSGVSENLRWRWRSYIKREEQSRGGLGAPSQV